MTEIKCPLIAMLDYILWENYEIPKEKAIDYGEEEDTQERSISPVCQGPSLPRNGN